MNVRLHLPHPHIAERFAEIFEHALHHGHPEVPAPRTVPAARDWDEWHWEDQR